MQNQGTTGIDLAEQRDSQHSAASPSARTPARRARARSATTQTNFRNFSAKVTSNSTLAGPLEPSNFKTTLGADYTNQRERRRERRQARTCRRARRRSARRAVVDSGGNTLQTVNKTLGLYAQEQASFRDRLFLIVAARTDQNSSFGTKFQRVVYPKASISWHHLRRELLPALRLAEPVPSARRVRRVGRAAGRHGRPPDVQREHGEHRGVARRARPARTRRASSPPRSATRTSSRSARPSTEVGFETSMLNNRVHFDCTYYTKKTHDALVSQPIAASSGASHAVGRRRTSASVANSGHRGRR